MTSVSDLRTREAKKRKTKRESKKVHFPTCIFFLLFLFFSFFQLDCPIWIHTFKKFQQKGENRREVEAKKKAKPEDQPNESSRLPLFQHPVPAMISPFSQ